MLQELSLALQSFQALMNLLKTAGHLSNDKEIEAAVSEVSTKLLHANAVGLASQEKQSALAAKVHDLEKEIANLKDWTAERERYELKEVARGLFARVEKGFVGDFQSAHKFCATCFEQNSKSPLQQEKIEVGRRLKLICHHCKASTIFDSYLKNS